MSISAHVLYMPKLFNLLRLTLLSHVLPSRNVRPILNVMGNRLRVGRLYTTSVCNQEN